MIGTQTRGRMLQRVAGAIFVVTMGSTLPAVAEDPGHAVESNALARKMWPNPPSPTDVRKGIEAALKIPDWQLKDETKAASQWTRVSGAIVDQTPSVEHDKVGRVRCAAWAWHNGLGETTLWAGSSSGGLYFLGRNPLIPAWRIWVPVSETLAGSPSVGSFLVRQGNSNQILIGTGDPGRWGDSGSGLYRTSDGGASWTRIALNPEPANYYKLVADPSDSSGARVYAATSEGVFISHDFGQTWGASYDGPTAMGVTDIVRPAAGTNWYLGVPGEGVVTCTVLTTTFNACTAGTGFGPDIGRVSIAISPANTSWIFALVNGAGYWDYTIYRSSNGGATFIDMDPRYSGDAMAWGQNFHTHAIAVDPASPNRVIVGLAAAQMTLNATAANPNDICWHRNVGVTGSGCDTTGLDAGHVDQTSMAFIPQSVAPGNTEILITNDGGIYTYDWAADTHDDRFNEWGLNISQTYNAPTFDLSLSDPNRALAGLQDNGIVQISRDATSDKYRYLFGADGGAVSIMPGNPDRYAVTNGMAYNRYNWWDGGPQVGMNVNLPGGGTPTMTHNP
ncbi:MAG: hypothetical protein V2I67_03660, partial [Thermoanaerobaculales bacterium]|nr:hypothetical protein [Thermoanaerobaculales bacterium]